MVNAKRCTHGWQGFLKESKLYLAYDQMKPVDRLLFWIELPQAAARFHYYQVCSWLKQL